MASGNMESITGSVPSSGQMAPCTKVNGKIVESMDVASSLAGTAQFMRESGWTESTMDAANSRRPMEKFSPELSRTANS